MPKIIYFFIFLWLRVFRVYHSLWYAHPEPRGQQVCPVWRVPEHCAHSALKHVLIGCTGTETKLE